MDQTTTPAPSVAENGLGMLVLFALGSLALSCLIPGAVDFLFSCAGQLRSSYQPVDDNLLAETHPCRVAYLAAGASRLEGPCRATQVCLFMLLCRGDLKLRGESELVAKDGASRPFDLPLEEAAVAAVQEGAGTLTAVVAHERYRKEIEDLERWLGEKRLIRIGLRAHLSIFCGCIWPLAVLVYAGLMYFQPGLMYRGFFHYSQEDRILIALVAAFELILSGLPFYCSRRTNHRGDALLTKLEGMYEGRSEEVTGACRVDGGDPPNLDAVTTAATVIALNGVDLLGKEHRFWKALNLPLLSQAAVRDEGSARDLEAQLVGPSQ